MALVSIIIPTYNRADLIGMTFGSVLSQTYTNWECIVVDDGSNDYTRELMEFYCLADSRIKYHLRPHTKPKGANACRNYGFKQSRGKYIQWFDSDDLMLPHFLEEKVKILDAHKVDFVISKAVNFQDPILSDIIDRNEYHYKFDQFPVNHYNYLVQNINWLTYDFMCRRSLVENIRFNENLRSAQERNFFTKVTCFSENPYLLDKYLTKRRIHEVSIQSSLKKDEFLKFEHELDFFYYTWLDFKKIDKRKKSRNYLFEEAVRITFVVHPKILIIKSLFWGFLSRHEYKQGFWFLLYHLSMKIFARGIYFRDRFRETSPILNQKRNNRGCVE